MPPPTPRRRWVLPLVWLALALAAPAEAVVLRKLTLDLRDASGNRIDARVSVRSDSLSAWYPSAPDSTILAHAGYAYPASGGSLRVPEGWITLSVTRGPEWRPFSRRVFLRRDTTVAVRLSRFIDMRARGFYSSDLHVHSRHDPIELYISPTSARRIARAEDLGILHLLDQEFRFTGALDSLSDATTLIYHSYEYRHMTYGHVVLPGLRQRVDWGCCLAPAEAWPLLDGLAPQVSAPGQALFVLAHPGTTEEYFDDRGWPGTGLGREYPLLGALGRLDGLEVASYSNFPNDRWDDWYDGLSAGLAVTPTAGTDAVLNIFSHRPAGGWRMYASLGAGAALDYRAWIEAVRQGHVFVTSLPLVRDFHVGAAGMGDALEAPADTLERPVTISVSCATGLTEVRLVGEHGTLWRTNLGPRGSSFTSWDTTFTWRGPTPVWMALRVEGVNGDRLLLDSHAMAHANAVRFVKQGQPRRDPAACGRMLDRVDALETLLDVRRGWASTAREDSVRRAIATARASFGLAFRRAPAAFTLLTAPGAAVERLQWTAATDDEAGDKVRYRITVGGDSLLAGGATTFWADTPWIASTAARASQASWWRVEAVDRGGNVTPCQPAVFRATLLVASTGVEPGLAEARPRAWPNPSRGPVRLRGLGPDAIIVDVTGRRVASRGDGLRREGEWLVWDGQRRGRRVAPGLYWALSRERGVTLPITVLE